MVAILDIFSGCGGLTLGAHQAGMRTAVAVDFDPILSSSFALNFPNTKLLCEDVRSLSGASIRALGPSTIDGVVGGPPCQAFSEIGRRAEDDPRRELVPEFFRIVRQVRPKFFLFENVRGLIFGRNRELLDLALGSLPAGWRVVGPLLLNAADFGAPTRRRRLFVLGFDTNEMDPPNEAELTASTGTATTVRDAIADLVSASEDGTEEGFDYWRYDLRRKVSDYAAQKRSQTGRFSGHRKTKHTESTLRRFAALEQGESDKIGKYVRLSWDGLCPTLRAGTGNDRGSYQAVRPIHPSLDRVITPREAARLQGFPDDFLFHPTVWHSCRMIGNSVSPIIAKALLERIKRALEGRTRNELAIAAE